MNTKAAIGLLAAVIILGGAFFFTHRAAAPAPVLVAPLASTTDTIPTPSTATPTTPIKAPEAPTKAPTGKKHIGAFDSATFTTASAHPRITGTANVSEVQVVIINSEGVGIVGGMHVPVVDGHWQFISTLALKPGTYTLQLGGVDTLVSATLVVTP